MPSQQRGVARCPTTTKPRHCLVLESVLDNDGKTLERGGRIVGWSKLVSFVLLQAAEFKASAGKVQ